MLPDTFSQGIGRKRARWRGNCGATQNGPKDDQCFQRV
uniref:Uncharacterized protein n=1 Tax=Cucumis melo TaxID=3656 RepID=A0A9I9E3R8_CUCME